MNLNQKDINELLIILNNSLVEVSEQLSHEYIISEAREAAEERRDAIRKWIHRLSQHIGTQE